jgi:hypothetical protein
MDIVWLGHAFEMIDGRLFKKSLPLPKLDVPRELVQTIMAMHHDSPLAGHRVIFYTQARIELQFWWPQFAMVVEEYIKACSTCNTTKVGRRVHVQPGSLAKGAPFSFHMDVLGLLPQTKGKNSCIISFVCVLSR